MLAESMDCLDGCERQPLSLYRRLTVLTKRANLVAGTGAERSRGLFVANLVRWAEHTGTRRDRYENSTVGERWLNFRTHLAYVDRNFVRRSQMGKYSDTPTNRWWFQ